MVHLTQFYITIKYFVIYRIKDHFLLCNLFMKQNHGFKARFQLLCIFKCPQQFNYLSISNLNQVKQENLHVNLNLQYLKPISNSMLKFLVICIFRKLPILTLCKMLPNKIIYKCTNSHCNRDIKKKKQ